MSTALALLFAAVVIFLGLALAGSLLQRQALLRRIAQLSQKSDLPPWLHGRSVLLISKGCPACAAALAEVRDSGDSHLLILAASDEAYGPEVIVDASSWTRLFPGYTPAVVQIDDHGHLLASEPVGSPAAMREQLLRLAT